jgi:hypothetical protein
MGLSLGKHWVGPTLGTLFVRILPVINKNYYIYFFHYTEIRSETVMFFKNK